jgi:hypothetical protein
MPLKFMVAQSAGDVEQYATEAESSELSLHNAS